MSLASSPTNEDLLGKPLRTSADQLPSQAHFSTIQVTPMSKVQQTEPDAPPLVHGQNIPVFH